MPPTPVRDAAIATLLGRWFPGREVTFGRVQQGGSTPVYRVTDGEVVTYLRIAEHPGERRDAEVRAHELARAAGIPVPEVLRYEAAPAELDRSAALTSTVPGIPLTDYPGDPASALRAAGRDLARLNAIAVQGWGWVMSVGPDGTLVAEHATRAAWAAEYLASAERLRAERHLPSPLLATLDKAMLALAALPDTGTSHLSHGDADTSHVHVDPGTGAYQGWIDLGEIRGADRLYDLGHLDVIEPDHLALALAGYDRPVGVAAIRLQAIAIATRAVAIQLDRLPSAWGDTLSRRLAALLAERITAR